MREVEELVARDNIVDAGLIGVNSSQRTNVDPSLGIATSSTSDDP
jgi:hypothetical protein